MKKFNKDKALNKLDNKNNSNIKRNTIIFSICILVFGIIYFSFARYEATNTYSLISGVVAEKKTIAQKMISLASNGVADLAYDGTDSLGEYGTPDNNLRYIGVNPNNYIYFNCSTSNLSEMNDSTCEKWRIIGLFNNIEDENGVVASRIKIVRAESLGIYAWDSSDSSVNSGWGINQWGPSTYEDSTSYEGADLMRELNTDYLGNITVGTDGKWYNHTNNTKSMNMPSNILNDSAQSMIQNIKWNTGSLSYDAGRFVSISSELLNVSYVYELERAQDFEQFCTGDYCNDTVIRTTTWIGKVALIYPSDYLYATSGGSTTNRDVCLSIKQYDWKETEVSDCQNNDWLFSNQYRWTLTPYHYTVTSEGSEGLVGAAAANNADDVYPTLFLKNNIVINSGDGSESNPYKLAKVSNYKILSGDLDTVGSEVKIADEEFYVIGQEDENHVKLLSKWNLNVGNNPKGTATNLQDSDVKGWDENKNNYGAVRFSDPSDYWGDGGNAVKLKPEYGSSFPAWVYTNKKENGIYIAEIAEYVDNYVTYLNQQGTYVTGRIINKDELVALGCNETTEHCDSDEGHGGTAPAWVYQTSYWTGTAYDDEELFTVYFNGNFYHLVAGDYWEGDVFGVRPVIILEK